MTVAIVVAAAVMPPVIGNAEHAIDRAHRAADTGADRAADDATDRTGDPVAFMSALLRAAHDALRMAGMGDREQRESERRGRKMNLQQASRRAASMLLILVFICSSQFLNGSAAIAGRAGICNADVAKRLRRRDEFRVPTRAPAREKCRHAD